MTAASKLSNQSENIRPEGGIVTTEIDHIVSQLNSMREGQEARVQHARQLLAEAEGELARVKAMLSAADVRPRQQPKPKRVVTTDAVQMVREAIANADWNKGVLGDVPGSFTVARLIEELGEKQLAKPTIRRALDVLRSEGLVRQAGMHSLDGTKPSVIFVKEGSYGSA
jgi:DNA-binding transcriptional ArsR family regulator